MNIGRKHRSKSTDDLTAEIADLRRRKREFAAAALPFKGDALARIDAVSETARGMLETLVVNSRGKLPDAVSDSSERLVRLFVYSSPEFAKRLRTIVENAPDALFATGTRADFERKLAEFDTEIAEREKELQRREIQARRDAIDGELAELEAVAS